MSSFLIEKAIAVTQDQHIRKSGGLVVETVNYQEFPRGSKLLNLKRIGNFNVQVVSHTTLNYQLSLNYPNYQQDNSAGKDQSKHSQAV